ncbi:hypothetical protein CQ054_22345 [Ochrobactrum sp. MYb29]|nr:hypothetical protein CQ054_22345 [Ochrobactrum sp. MYb29]
MNNVELGLGLLSIGREWGVRNVPPPSFETALSLLQTAFNNGVRFYDTAPAYADSEKILGEAIATGLLDRRQVAIASKMGEYWDETTSTSFTNHSFTELAAGIDKSLKLLGNIDLLQLHKADENNITSDDVFRALNKAENEGIKSFGASVKDVRTALLACESGRYDYIQFPYNRANTELKELFSLTRRFGVKLIINRPFAMGSLLDSNQTLQLRDLFQYILDEDFSGYVLTGTSSQHHLLSNINAFRSAGR